MESLVEESSTKKIELKDHSNESIHLLLETIEGINRTMELKSLLSESMEAVRLVMKSEASSLMLLDEDTGELFVSLPTGPVKDEIKGKRIPKNEGIGGWVVENERPYLSNDLEESEVFYGDLAENFKTRNIICVPLINKKGNTIGVMQALNKRKNKDFTPHDIPVFQALASHVTIAIERTRKQERLLNRLKEKEVLLTEIHHRVKNNLSTITALIEMELNEVEDEHAKYVLKNTYSRIRSMIEVHDLLCDKGLFDKVELGLYLSKLTEKISETLTNPRKQVDINLTADTINIAADKAMVCGLVLNELMINIYKHAFNNVETGQIDIELLHKRDNIVALNVADNGVGIPEDFDLENANSVGTWVINVLLRKLNATVEIEAEEGTSFSIEFEK
ncbi:MAG: histidine kinase dimerization/phosphoacceptor domain -containing protein [Balneolaceae bacterium]|nr:histidine kinase dimerization/phosphoacceptor domain -containing protein [Balneolaceae bacterium]